VNNSCPSCGAIYNVAQKDIGRRIKCKKCGTGLVVTEAGLEVDGGAPVPAGGAPLGDDAYDDRDDAAPAPRPRRSAQRSAGGPGLQLDPIQMFKDIGGVPTVLFAFGAFLVIVFLFMPIVGIANVSRKQAKLMEEQNSLAAAERRYNEKENKTTDDEKNIETLRKNSKKKQTELADDVSAARVASGMDSYRERYGMMFGFVFLMFGAIGYLMPGQPSTRRIVGAIVVTAQMVIVFLMFAGFGGGPPRVQHDVRVGEKD
jgi:predicted Zn finger-like uncharacterized protein